ncbi:MAG: DUF2341 domain-containing protein, partial [Candidatus Falkowbacteria bacterium]|nr:DUF2341 domain-containing protein [Candidatus Falkowbacteria bacterium]
MKFHLPKIKTKKTLKIVLPVLLVLIFSAAYFFIPKPQVAAASWWNDSWMYRRSIKITNNTSEQTNVYIIETIDTSATTSFQTDCGDLRFVTEQGELLDYYVVSDCWTDHTVIHTQFKTFPAGEQTIYYYYGNPSAPNGFSAADFATLASNYTVGAISSPETGGGPVSYWSFDDPSAGTGVTGGVHDESGQGYNGRNYNAMQKDKSECVVGSCLYFDGLDLTRIEADTKDNMQEFTVCTWFKANSLTNPDNENENWLISKNWVLSFFKSGKLRFWVPTNGGTYPQVLSSVNIEANKWYHVCAIYYGSGIADPKMYINGIDKSGQSYEGGNPQNDDSIIELYIGAGTQNPYAYNFQGYIDEVKIYPYARTADQIRQDYNAGLAGVKTSHGVLVAFGNSSDKWLTDGLIGYWKMDESATTTGAIDSSGHYATSTYYGNASTTAGKFGRGGVFNGIADSAVVVGVSQTLQPSNITFSAWIKRTKSWSEGYSEFFYAKKDDEWDSNGWYFQSNNVGADKCLEIMVDGGNGFYVTCTPDSTFPLNQWTHIAFTFNSSTNSYAAYINGTIQSVSASGNPDSISGTDDLKYITVGGNGLIDEVRIYNRALSASEVAKLYEWAPGPVLHLKMDEKTGNTAYDSSGNGNSGTITGATWARGKYGSALSFDGSDGNYVDLGTGSELALNRYTVSAWINVSSLVSEHAGRVVDRRTTGLNVNYILGVYMDGHADF